MEKGILNSLGREGCVCALPCQLLCYFLFYYYFLFLDTGADFLWKN